MVIKYGYDDGWYKKPHTLTTHYIDWQPSLNRHD